MSKAFARHLFACKVLGISNCTARERCGPKLCSERCPAVELWATSGPCLVDKPCALALLLLSAWLRTLPTCSSGSRYRSLRLPCRASTWSSSPGCSSCTMALQGALQFCCTFGCLLCCDRYRLCRSLAFVWDADRMSRCCRRMPGLETWAASHISPLAPSASTWGLPPP